MNSKEYYSLQMRRPDDSGFCGGHGHSGILFFLNWYQYGTVPYYGTRNISSLPGHIHISTYVVQTDKTMKMFISLESHIIIMAATNTASISKAINVPSYSMKQSRHMLHWLIGNQHLNQGHTLNVHVSPGQNIRIIQHVNMPMSHYPKIVNGK